MMILTTFGYKDIRYTLKNLFYFLDVTFSYKNTGLVFLNNDLSVNFIVLLVVSPVLLYFYIKEQKNYKSDYTLRHKVEIKLKNKKYTYTGYLDTGNKLEDPYKKRGIILVYDSKLQFKYENSILVPYKTLDGEGVIKCQKIDSLKIDDKLVGKDILVGKSKEKFNIEGVDCILPNKIREELL